MLLKSITDPRYTKAIINCIQSFMRQEQKHLSQINRWGTDICDKLSSFSISGKMLRGNFICYISEAYSHTLSDTSVIVAAALELFHSSLLIHDDIIDNDSYRRGQKTIFEQYKISYQIPPTSDFGKQMGICVGDAGFFMAMKLLHQITNTEVGLLFANELINVVVGQMQDIYFSYILTPVKQDEIEKVYLYKTARYSFSLPFVLGATIAKISKTEIEKLQYLGETMGLLFQIKDDELNLFGNMTSSGKPVGSDIRENKKTLYYYWLFKKANTKERQKLLQIFGNKNITQYDIHYVKKLICNYKIQNIIKNKILLLNKKAEKIIRLLSMSHKYKNGLLQLLQFITERNG